MSHVHIFLLGAVLGILVILGIMTITQLVRLYLQMKRQTHRPRIKGHE